MAESQFEEVSQEPRGMRGMRGKIRGFAQNFWAITAALIVLFMMFTMFTMFTIVEPGQVAVRVNNVPGTTTSIVEPGWVLRLPSGVHSLHVLDASPQTLQMKGDRDLDVLRVEKLTVRASDGASFYFEDTTLIFEINGSEVATVARDVGVGYAYQNWIEPYARTILGDEFGREFTISVSNPSNYGAATDRAQTELNKHLEPHGIKITQIVMSRPRFSAEYERLIEELDRLPNELDVIRSNLELAKTERERTLSEVDRVILDKY